MPDQPTAVPAVFQARLEPGGHLFCAAADEPLLQAAESAGLVIPSSCRNGTCRTCLCRLREGRVRFRVEWPGLSAEEKAEGYILACVACAATDVVLELSRGY